jgi:hypothetical protein
MYPDTKASLMGLKLPIEFTHKDQRSLFTTWTRIAVEFLGVKFIFSAKASGSYSHSNHAALGYGLGLVTTRVWRGI